jgi:uncharacterized protein (DUF2147 family)
MQILTRSTLPAALAILITATAGADSRISVDQVTGPWLTEKKGAVIEIYECGPAQDRELCGRIVWLKKPYTDDGELKRDPENPDPALRDRPLCGIEVFTGLKRNDKDTWTFGHVYNPKDGKHYRAYLNAYEDGTVRIRGYIGIPLIGKSETWTRPDGIDIGCPDS